jgi:hypothetical protein
MAPITVPDQTPDNAIALGLADRRGFMILVKQIAS